MIKNISSSRSRARTSFLLIHVKYTIYRVQYRQRRRRRRVPRVLIKSPKTHYSRARARERGRRLPVACRNHGAVCRASLFICIYMYTIVVYKYIQEITRHRRERVSATGSRVRRIFYTVENNKGGRKKITFSRVAISCGWNDYST